MKNSHLAAVLVASLCGVALPRLRVRSCGCDDLTVFEQPGFFNSLLGLKMIAAKLMEVKQVFTLGWEALVTEQGGKQFRAHNDQQQRKQLLQLTDGKGVGQPGAKRGGADAGDRNAK